MEAQRLGVPLEEELHWRSLEPNLGQWGRSVQANGTGSPQWTWGAEGTLAAWLLRLRKGAYPGITARSVPPRPEDSQLSRAPWACPHLYRIKCFVY